MLARVVVFLAMSISLIGCGGSLRPTPQSSNAQAALVVRRYYEALESGHGGAVCALLTEAARERMTRLVESQIKRSVSCTTLMSQYAKAVSGDAAELRDLRAAKIGPTTVTGDRATVVVKEPHGTTRAAQLVRSTNGWRIGGLVVLFAPPRKAIEG